MTKKSINRIYTKYYTQMVKATTIWHNSQIKLYKHWTHSTGAGTAIHIQRMAPETPLSIFGKFIVFWLFIYCILRAFVYGRNSLTWSDCWYSALCDYLGEYHFSDIVLLEVHDTIRNNLDTQRFRMSSKRFAIDTRTIEVYSVKNALIIWKFLVPVVSASFRIHVYGDAIYINDWTESPRCPNAIHKILLSEQDCFELVAKYINEPPG